MTPSEPRKPNNEPDRRWQLIAEELKNRAVPGSEHALAFVQRFSLIVCGGMVWRPLHEPTHKAHDIDVIAADPVALQAAVASIFSGYDGTTMLAKTRFGGDRISWTHPTPNSLDIWVVPPPLLMTFVAELVPGKRTLWSPGGIVLDLDPPGVVPPAGFVEPYNVASQFELVSAEPERPTK